MEDNSKVTDLERRVEELERRLRAHLGAKGQTTTPQIPHSNMSRTTDLESAVETLEAADDALYAQIITAGRYL